MSTNSLTALSLHFDFPIYQCLYDSLSQSLFVSCRQKNDPFSQAMQRNIFAGIDAKTNRIKWLNESVLYDLILSGNTLIVSNSTRSVRYNKQAGFDELRYPAPVHVVIPGTQLALAFRKEKRDTVECLDLRSGLSRWLAPLPENEDWVDHCLQGDSVLLVASAGLHALHLRKGLLWSVPLITSMLTAKALVYSLAQHKSIEEVSRVVHTAGDENVVSQLASNILTDEHVIYLASKEKCLAIDNTGKMLWSLDLRSYPVSKMMLMKTDSGLALVNFGLAVHSERFVNWGRPFILMLNPSDGSIRQEYDLSKIDNLADFMSYENSIVFAGKVEILQVKPGDARLKTILALDENRYGRFVEFIDGNAFYTFKEGYYVPLNFINGNLVYFKADNNKIYGIDGDLIQYEYHFTDLYSFKGKWGDMMVLGNEEKTVIISPNYELMYEISTGDPVLLAGDNLYFQGEYNLMVLRRSDLK
ncbi:MAG TPA: hypothetical protein PLQ93_03455 [Bacteroidia bacterium]|nr:hypothetical protein [Bacteroidia bacterium]